MNLLSSLENILPTYETTLPFSKEKVSFTPFRVKDAKGLSIVLQEENKKLALNAMVELLKSNAKNCNVLNLCLADAEYLFLQIRSKSVDEQLNLIYNNQKINVFIPSIGWKNDLVSDTIQINTNFYLTLETPKIKDLLKLNSLDKEQLVKACVKKVTFNGEVFYVNKFVNEEIKEMMDNLPLNVLSKFEDFLSKQPELTVVVKTDTEEKEVSGLLTFFTFR
jgi:hypothetical protein